jgi:hypothetical protein
VVLSEKSRRVQVFLGISQYLRTSGEPRSSGPAGTGEHVLEQGEESMAGFAELTAVDLVAGRERPQLRDWRVTSH